MSVDSEQEWFWLQKIYESMVQTNALLDWIVPIATVVLALAAVYLAYRSYRASRDANDQAARFRQEDLAEQDLRWRRTFAVDLREWFWSVEIMAMMGGSRDEDIMEFQRLIRECDLAGQDSAKRLARRLKAMADDKRKAFEAMTPKDQARAMHPSRMMGDKSVREVVDAWVREPSSIESMLDDFDAKRREDFARLVESLPGGSAE